MPLITLRNDITLQKADIIVNPANRHLLEGTGTSEAIYNAAGREQLTAICSKLAPVHMGDVVVTPAFNLPAQYIFHAVVPRWLEGEYREEKILEDVYKNSLQKAIALGCKSIAFPLLSSGYLCFPRELAFKIAQKTIEVFLESHDIDVYLVIYDQKSLDVSNKLLEGIDEYINDKYVEERKAFLCSERDIDTLFEPRQLLTNIDDELNKIGKNFKQMLFEFIDAKGLKDADVYNKAGVSRQIFANIRNKINYRPSKIVILKLALVLELNLQDTKKLLASAEYALSSSKMFDLIIEYCIKNKCYDFSIIDMILYDRGEPVLASKE